MVQRHLNRELMPQCHDCLYREIGARMIPNGAIIANIRELADRFAQEAIEAVRFMQGRSGKERGPDDG